MNMRVRVARVLFATIIGVMLTHGIISDLTGEKGWSLTFAVVGIFLIVLIVRELATSYYLKHGP